MSNVRVEVNWNGVRELMKSPEMMAVCRDRAEPALASLGDGYVISEFVGESRVNVSIGAVSKEAIQENLDNNTILCALGGA